MSIVQTRDFDPSNAYTKSTISTNVSSCVLWLPCDETGTITTLTDAISGDTVTLGSTDDNGSGAVNILNDATNAFNGTLPTLTGSFAFLTTADFEGSALASIMLGGGSNAIKLNSASSQAIGSGGTANLGTVLTTAGTRKNLILSDATAPTTSLWQSASGTVLSEGTPSATAIGTINPDDNFDLSTVNPDTPVFSIALFDFSANGIPHDFMIWADWMMEQWAANNKVIPVAAANW